jgi:hypothetical protein
MKRLEIFCFHSKIRSPRNQEKTESLKNKLLQKPKDPFRKLNNIFNGMQILPKRMTAKMKK